MKRLHLFGATLLLTGAVLPAHAADWPQFLGPNGSAVSTEKGLPAEWAADKNVAWSAKVPGYAWSSPIVVGDKVFVTTAVADKQAKPSGGRGGGGGGGFGGNRKPPDEVYKWELHCLNASDGSVVWKQTAAEQKPTFTIHGSSTYAVETPVTDGKFIYVYFGMTGAFCYDLSGKQIWKADLGSFKMAMGWGTGSSPALDDERFYVQCDNEEKSFLVALDKKNGKELWRDRAHREIRLEHAAGLEEQDAHGDRLRRQSEGALLRSGHGQAALGAGRLQWAASCVARGVR